MATLIQTFQAALPLDLFERLSRVRTRYAAVLRGAAAGDFSRARELRSLSRYLGRLLAKEARKAPEERGGLRMLDLSLAVDQLLPELRGWNQYEALQQHRSRLLGLPVAKLPLPVVAKRSQAS